MASAITLSAFFATCVQTSVALAEQQSSAEKNELPADIMDEYEEFSADESSLEPAPTGVVNVVGKTLEGLAMTPDKDVLILKFTAGCPACLAFRTAVEQVAKATGDIDSLVIGFYRSDQNFSKAKCYTVEEALSDPVPKIFPANHDDGTSSDGVAIGMKNVQAENIARFIHDHATHKFDLEVVLQRLRATHAETDQLFVDRFKNFSLEMCREDTRKGKTRKGQQATYYRSLCDPSNPCSEKELTWFSHIMTFPARSKSFQDKEKENRVCLKECMECKNSTEYEEYLQGLQEFAQEQLELRAERLQRMEERKAEKTSSEEAAPPKGTNEGQ